MLLELSLHALLKLGKFRIFVIHSTFLAGTLCKQPWMCELSDTLTACIKFFSTNEGGHSKDVVKKHTTAMAAFKAFGFANSIDLTTTTIKDGCSEPTDELKETNKDLKETANDTERAMCSFCASVHVNTLYLS